MGLKSREVKVGPKAKNLRFSIGPQIRIPSVFEEDFEEEIRRGEMKLRLSEFGAFQFES